MIYPTHYFQKISQVTIIFACIASMLGIESAHAGNSTKAIRQTARITFQNDKTIVSEINYDTDISLETSVGKVKVPASSLSKVEISNNPNNALVQLRSGDSWQAVINDNILDQLDVDNSSDLLELHGSLQTINFNFLQSYSETSHLNFMKLILNDGSQALINTSDTLLSLETEYGKWKVPIGSLRALKFVSPYGSDEPNSVIMRLHTGYVKRMQLSSKHNFIRTSDIYGNKLKVYFQDITGILSETRFENNQTEASTTANTLRDFNILLKNGESGTASLPVSLLKYKTDAGELQVLTPMIASIKECPESEGKQVLTTIYGEVIPGELTSNEISIIDENDDGYTYIETDDLESASTDLGSNSVPESWLVWYLKSGIITIGRFEDLSSSLETENESEVQFDAIFSLRSTSEDDVFENITQDGNIEIYKTTSSKVKIALLTTGTTISVPWKDVCMVKSQRLITPDLLNSMPVSLKVAKKKSENKKKKSKQKTNILSLKTAIGSMDIEPDMIAMISIDRPASKACVTSVNNDKFLVSVPSKKWVGDLINIDDYTFPDEDIFDIKVNNPQTPYSQSQTFVCRLITGDIVHGTVLDQELYIKKNDSKSDPIKVDVRKLKQISRDDENSLLFQLQRGSILAKPKQRYLEVKLLINGNKEKIDFKQIETLIVNGSKLPPTTYYNKGMPASLKNEMLVEGGSFMQGSESGIPDEIPVHSASVGSFYMDSTEVTRAQFAAFVRDTDYKTLAEQTDSETTWKTPGFIQRNTDPAVCIAWNDAVEYCNWRSSQTALPKCYLIDKGEIVETDRTAMGYRLPTEAEWEFAARSAGKDNTYAWDSSSTQTSVELANYHQEPLSEDRWVWTNPVQTYPPNELGLYGLSGNVWEWCEDLYFDMAYSALRNNTVHNPCITHANTPGLNRRVMRGGSFKNQLDLLRCSSRGNGHPYAFSNHVGFRCVRNAE